MLVDSFVRDHSFLMVTKSDELPGLLKTQKVEEQVRCEDRILNHVKPVTVHEDLYSKDLPENVRGKLFFHYHHFCAVLGCPHAPIDEVKKLLKNSNKFVSVFPRLIKDFKVSDPVDFLIKYSFTRFKKNVKLVTLKYLLEGEGLERKYLEMENALAFLVSPQLHGKRHVGPKLSILNANQSKKVVLIQNELNDLNPICLVNPSNGRSVILSPQDLNAPVKVNGLNVTVEK